MYLSLSLSLYIYIYIINRYSYSTKLFKAIVLTSTCLSMSKLCWASVSASWG